MLDENVAESLMRAGHQINALQENERRLLDQLWQAKKDTERLDHIASNTRCDPKLDGQHVWWPTSFNARLIGPTLRDAIDAKMRAER